MSSVRRRRASEADYPGPRARGDLAGLLPIVWSGRLREDARPTARAGGTAPLALGFRQAAGRRRHHRAGQRGLAGAGLQRCCEDASPLRTPAPLLQTRVALPPNDEVVKHLDIEHSPGLPGCKSASGTTLPVAGTSAWPCHEHHVEGTMSGDHSLRSALPHHR